MAADWSLHDLNLTFLFWRGSECASIVLLGASDVVECGSMQIGQSSDIQDVKHIDVWTILAAGLRKVTMRNQCTMHIQTRRFGQNHKCYTQMQSFWPVDSVREEVGADSVFDSSVTSLAFKLESARGSLIVYMRRNNGCPPISETLLGEN
ncbi:uncharacterized protein EDB93DRAFT_1106124 [Suillus bovinus]|uniref:uncharacterized protein n=1 Tax=Suillus bovinus TaxID=48563 RepID=UPI001B876D8E|nr:uncharacterized protein EDB93DRAFT_1106124 [Suillus bovinus]KAG2139139.1 hypothetical protein EDB93DRAFT_1106124 [Suillus bovinus]